MQKIYGGLVSSPVNKMDTYRGSAVTRTTSGAVVDGDIPIGEEYEMPFYMKVTYEGDGENPVNILTKNVSNFGSFILDELDISKMTIDGKELSFKDLTVINRCPPDLGGVCNIYTYVFGDTNDHILTIYAKKGIRKLRFAPWTSGPAVVDDACFSKIKKVEYYVASYIYEYSFYKAANLSSVKVSDNIISIGNNAFTGCSSLTSFTIPSSVTSIGNNAFNGCSSLTSVTVEAITPPTLSSGTIPNNVTNIYVPAASVDTYKAASGWSTYAGKIQAIPEE